MSPALLKLHFSPQLYPQLFLHLRCRRLGFCLGLPININRWLEVRYGPSRISNSHPEEETRKMRLDSTMRMEKKNIRVPFIQISSHFFVCEKWWFFHPMGDFFFRKTNQPRENKLSKSQVFQRIDESPNLHLCLTMEGCSITHKFCLSHWGKHIAVVSLGVMKNWFIFTKVSSYLLQIGWVWGHQVLSLRFWGTS